MLYLKRLLNIHPTYLAEVLCKLNTLYRQPMLSTLPKGSHFNNVQKLFKTFNRAKFRNGICNENWEFLAPALDPNQMWTEWKTKFLQIVDKHAPIRIKRVRSKNSPWITADLKERMHNRDTLKIKAIKSNDPHDWGQFQKNA